MTDGRQRTLLVIRHAKSDWGAGEPDIRRPLSKRGRRDAPEVGRWLARQGLDPDWAGVSPATRTQQTWQLLAAAGGLTTDTTTVPGLYLGDVPDLLDALREVPADAAAAALVVHLPGCADLASWLTAGRGDEAAQAAMQEKFPTGALARIELAVPWSELTAGSGALTDFAVLRG